MALESSMKIRQTLQDFHISDGLLTGSEALGSIQGNLNFNFGADWQSPAAREMEIKSRQLPTHQSPEFKLEINRQE